LKIAIVCSNNIFCEGLKELLKDDHNIQVIGIFTSGSGSCQDIKEILKLGADIVLLEFNAHSDILFSLPDNLMRADSHKIVLIGDRSLSSLAPKDVKDLIVKGVVGILPQGADSDLLKKILNAVYSGEMSLGRTVLTKLFSPTKEQKMTSTLGKREQEIVLHICQGYRNKEIAQKLKISEQTVKSHCNRIYKKLGVTDRLQLALYSHKIGPFATKT
jgi:two-component system, NarL family, response regulator DegU